MDTTKTRAICHKGFVCQETTMTQADGLYWRQVCGGYRDIDGQDVWQHAVTYLHNPSSDVGAALSALSIAGQFPGKPEQVFYKRSILPPEDGADGGKIVRIEKQNHGEAAKITFARYTLG